jgi:hypothetical protein
MVLGVGLNGTEKESRENLLEKSVVFAFRCSCKPVGFRALIQPF